MSGKLPSIQLYTGDWMKDPALRSVSAAARGLWIDMMCLMFESTRRGYLELSPGVAVTEKELSRMTGMSPKEVKKRLVELKRAVVFSTSEDGVIYSRRMVRDEAKRLQAKEYGKRGGNPALLETITGGVNPNGRNEDKAKQTPSSSSSISSSSSDLRREGDSPPEKQRPRFQKPTPDEVRAYIAERGDSIDADRFVDFYESKGWKVGKEPMKDWKAAARNWARDKPRRQGQIDYSAVTDGMADDAARGLELLEGGQG